MPLVARANGTVVNNQVLDLDFLSPLLVTLIAPGVIQVSVPNGAITTALLAAGAVDTLALAANAVGTGNIQDNAVTTVKIPNGAITPEKLSLAYILAGTDVAPPMLAQDSYWNTATSKVSGSSTTVLTFDIVIPNDVFYDIELEGWMNVRCSTNGDQARSYIEFTTVAGVLILQSQIAAFTRIEIGHLMNRIILSGRKGETIRCNLVFTVGGGTSSNYYASGLHFRGFPQK